MKNHFEKDYNKLVSDKLSLHDKEKAMADSIGGNFVHFGIFQRELLVQHGLKPTDTIVDVGCGSGRLANALKELESLKYTGIDVVQELLDYAKQICNRKDWTFYKATDLKIPLPDHSADWISCFSVFTHLLHEESYAYLAEMRRVLKPGGKIAFSFLDFSIPNHWTVFTSNLCQLGDRVHLNQFMDEQAIKVWCQHLQFEIEGIFPGNQPHIGLKEPITSKDGKTYRNKVALGQSVCILKKPTHCKNTIYALLPKEFDAQTYLALNPDVADSNIDPAVHFLTCGQYENRRIK